LIFEQVDLGSNFAVEINLSNNHTKSGETIVLNVLCRKATKKEIEKEDATAAILRNMNGTRHSSLHACIVRLKSKSSKFSKLCTILVVIIVKIIFICSFLF